MVTISDGIGWSFRGNNSRLKVVVDGGVSIAKTSKFDGHQSQFVGAPGTGAESWRIRGLLDFFMA